MVCKENGGLPVPPRVVRGNEFHQRVPQYDLLYLLEELALAGFLEVEIEAQSCLFFGLNFPNRGLTTGIEVALEQATCSVGGEDVTLPGLAAQRDENAVFMLLS